jgi:hypothetical protein
LKLALVACNTRRARIAQSVADSIRRSYFRRIELRTRRLRIYLDIWFRLYKEVCFWSCDWTRAWITWARLATVRRRSRLLSMQYGICIRSCSCCFGCFGCLVCSGRAPSLGGTNVVGSRAHARALSEGT